MSMREIKAMGAGILTSKKNILLSAFSPPIALPLYETTDQRILPVTGVAVSASVACISAAVQDARLLEPHSVSAVAVGEKFVPLRDLSLESSDGGGRFVPIAVDWRRVVVEGGFVLSVTN